MAIDRPHVHRRAWGGGGGAPEWLERVEVEGKRLRTFRAPGLGGWLAGLVSLCLRCCSLPASPPRLLFFSLSLSAFVLRLEAEGGEQLSCWLMPGLLLSLLGWGWVPLFLKPRPGQAREVKKEESSKRGEMPKW
jgi:hypothetical protein